MYDNVVEYWVTVRETGAYEEEHEILERTKSTRKAHLENVFLCMAKIMIDRSPAG